MIEQQVLDTLIDTIKNGWDVLYPVLYKQVQFKGIVNGSFALLSFITFIISVRLMFKYLDDDDFGDGFEEIVIFFLIISFVLFIVFALPFLNFIINPEWMVIKLLTNNL